MTRDHGRAAEIAMQCSGFPGKASCPGGPSGYRAIINRISSPVQETGSFKLDSNELCRNYGFLQSLEVVFGSKEVSHSLGK